MFFKVLSRASIECESYYNSIKESSMPHVILSTTSTLPYDVNIKENSNCKGILRFHFDDVDLEHKKYLIENNKVNKYNLFYVEHAKQILNFINDKINSIGAIICHCDAGWSRSAGTGASLSKIINGEDDLFFKNYGPNMLVYTTILTEYYYNSDKYINILKYKEMENVDIGDDSAELLLGYKECDEEV